MGRRACKEARVVSVANAVGVGQDVACDVLSLARVRGLGVTQIVEILELQPSTVAAIVTHPLAWRVLRSDLYYPALPSEMDPREGRRVTAERLGLQYEPEKT